MGAKLARIIYRMLKYGPEYVDKGNEFYEEKISAATDPAAHQESCRTWFPNRESGLKSSSGFLGVLRSTSTSAFSCCAKSGSWRTRADLEICPTTEGGKMRILVTGAQGCIGAWVVKNLLDRGLDVLIYDADPTPAQLRKAAVETGRIEDGPRLKAVVKDGGITHIVHLAAVLMPFCQAQPAEGGIVNVIGTLNVFEAARDAGRAVRVVYASSSAVWGPEEAYGSGKLTEEDPLKPSTHYGVFKQANEGNARVFYLSSGISSVGLRPWTVYGVGRDRGLTADPTLAMRAVALSQPFRIRLTGHMDLQYVADVAESF